jgi:hypothetical protein
VQHSNPATEQAGAKGLFLKRKIGGRVLNHPDVSRLEHDSDTLTGERAHYLPDLSFASEVLEGH